MDRSAVSDLADQLRPAGRRIARATIVASAWLGNRLQDLAMWLVNLLRELPPRVGRLAVALWRGLRGVVLALPQARRAANDRTGSGLRGWLWRVPRDVGIWLIVLLFRVFDLFGVPELWSFLLQMVCHVTPLTGQEIGTAAGILGPIAIRYADVRIAEGGALNLIFARNGGRAFTTFHTVNLPRTGPHCRENFEILLHELVHVYQYERTGGLYVAEAIYAQNTTGYSYGSPDDLVQCLATGACYRNFNREQQAQMVQDYFVRCQSGQPVTGYEPFIADMRLGNL
jgi:hypothetical protein